MEIFSDTKFIMSSVWLLAWALITFSDQLTKLFGKPTATPTPASNSERKNP